MKNVSIQYLTSVTSFEDLKAQYRALCMEHHPDRGGELETMQQINNEYDQLFPIWKHRDKVETTETAYTTRSDFYTQNGWQGSNYNGNITTKEIANIMREYVKDVYNDYRFSIRLIDYNHIYIGMSEAPEQVFSNPDDERGEMQINHYYIERDERLTASAREIMKDICQVLQSYNYDDSDSMIDYFDTNFYISLSIGSWDKPIKIVPRTRTARKYTEYETVTITKTRKVKKIVPVQIETPEEIKQGDLIQIKGSFNYGIRRGGVYQVDYNGGNYVSAYWMGRNNKQMCKGSARGNQLHTSPERLKEWAAKGWIIFVKLEEITETEEYTSQVRRAKKSSGVSTDVREPGEDSTGTSQSSQGSKDYTITEDTDTRDGSALWVVKFSERMSKEEYKETAAAIKEIGGYYSKFKKGFIFREDPAALLVSLFGGGESPQEQTEQNDGKATGIESSYNLRELLAMSKEEYIKFYFDECARLFPNATMGIEYSYRDAEFSYNQLHETHDQKEQDQRANAEQEERDQITAANIEDTSTEILYNMRPRPTDFKHSTEYRHKLSDYLAGLGETLTHSAIEKIEIPELREVVKELTKEIQGAA